MKYLVNKQNRRKIHYFLPRNTVNKKSGGIQFTCEVT